MSQELDQLRRLARRLNREVEVLALDAEQGRQMHEHMLTNAREFPRSDVERWWYATEQRIDTACRQARQRALDGVIELRGEFKAVARCASVGGTPSTQGAK